MLRWSLSLTMTRDCQYDKTFLGDRFGFVRLNSRFRVLFSNTYVKYNNFSVLKDAEHQLSFGIKYAGISGSVG